MYYIQYKYKKTQIATVSQDIFQGGWRGGQGLFQGGWRGEPFFKVYFCAHGGLRAHIISPLYRYTKSLHYGRHIYLAPFLAVYVCILCPIINITHICFGLVALMLRGGNTFFKVGGGGDEAFFQVNGGGGAGFFKVETKVPEEHFSNSIAWSLSRSKS